MLDRYLRIRAEPKQVAESRGFALHFQRSSAFRQRAERYNSFMKQVHFISVEMQNRGSTLADCRLVLNVLIYTIDRKKNIQSSAFYKSGLSTHYIALNSELSPVVAFESDVVKLQRGHHDDLTDTVISACSILKVTQDSQFPAGRKLPTVNL